MPSQNLVFELCFCPHEGEKSHEELDGDLFTSWTCRETTTKRPIRMLVSDMRAWLSNKLCTLFRRASCAEDIDALEEFRKLPPVNASTTTTVVADHLELILPVFPRLLVWADEDDDEKQNATEEGLVQQMVALHDKALSKRPARKPGAVGGHATIIPPEQRVVILTHDNATQCPKCKLRSATAVQTPAQLAQINAARASSRAAAAAAAEQ